MTDMAHVFTKDARFMHAVDVVIDAFATAQNESVRVILTPAKQYLDLRYHQHQSCTAIARHLHCSQKTLRRYYERDAHRVLYARLQAVAPDLAHVFALCFEPVRVAEEACLLASTAS